MKTVISFLDCISPFLFCLSVCFPSPFLVIQGRSTVFILCEKKVMMWKKCIIQGVSNYRPISARRADFCFKLLPGTVLNMVPHCKLYTGTVNSPHLFYSYRCYKLQDLFQKQANIKHYKHILDRLSSVYRKRTMIRRERYRFFFINQNNNPLYLQRV